jgi:hypothetical protein
MKITKQEMLKALKPNYIKFNVYTIHDLPSLHKGHFFSKDTMKYWGSRLVGEIYVSNLGIAYFVTSELNYDRTQRFFTIRSLDTKTGKVDSCSGFLAYTTKTQALTQALKLAYSNQ